MRQCAQRHHVWSTAPKLIRSSRRLAVSGMFVVLLAALPLPPAFGQTSEEARLGEAEAQLEAVRAEMERTEAQRDSNASALASAESRLAEVEDAVAAAEQAVQRQQRAVTQASAVLASLEDDERERQRSLVTQLVQDYKRPPSGVEAVLSPGSLDGFLRRIRYLDAMGRDDQAAMEQARVGQVRVDAQRDLLRLEQKVLERVVVRKRDLLAEAEELRSTRALRLAAAEDELNGLEEREQLLAADREQLAAAVKRASRAASASRTTAASAEENNTAPAPQSVGGGWVWPTSGPVTSEFGPRWGRMHEGIDIGAPTGAAIYAAASGQVTFAGWMGGYGQLTLVDHGGGIVTASAHQSSIGVTVGQRVAAGQVIGAVGATGNVTGPHLHFETRVNGSAQNPRNYLP